MSSLDANLQLFASYSPAEVVLRYATDPRVPERPEHAIFDAAIGFVDGRALMPSFLHGLFEAYYDSRDGGDGA